MKIGGLLLVLAIVVFGCEKNNKPVISDITCLPEDRFAGITFTLKASAYDSDGDEISYLWECATGHFLAPTDKAEIKWESPLDGAGKTHTVSVIVSDGKDEAMKAFQILLGEPMYGEVAGYVYFTNFKIPITGALVSVGSITSITDERGHFSMGKVAGGDYTLMVTKQSGWSNHGNGDNTSGFSAMPTGRVNDNGTFMDIGNVVYFWKSDILSFFGLTYDSDLVYGFSGNEKMASPIRCVKNK